MGSQNGRQGRVGQRQTQSDIAALRSCRRRAVGGPPWPVPVSSRSIFPRRKSAIRDLASLKSLTSLRELLLNNTTVSDTGLRQLAELRNLRRLGLAGTLVRGDGFQHLKLPSLADLDLTSAPVNDEGLKHIAALGGIEAPPAQLLGYHRCQRSGARKAQSLKVLNLDGTDVGDGTLRSWVRFPHWRNGARCLPLHRQRSRGTAPLGNLRRLGLGHTRTTNAGIAVVAS